jgi:hypothetical protein
MLAGGKAMIVNRGVNAPATGCKPSVAGISV